MHYKTLLGDYHTFYIIHAFELLQVRDSLYHAVSFFTEGMHIIIRTKRINSHSAIMDIHL